MSTHQDSLLPWLPGLYGPKVLVTMIFFFLVLYVQLHIEQVKAQRKEDFSCIRVKRKREGNTSKTRTQMGKI